MVRGVRVVNKVVEVAGVMLLLELKKLSLGETWRDGIDIDFEVEVECLLIDMSLMWTQLSYCIQT